MPDWITHILAAWMICTILSFKYKQINPAYTVVCMVGALIPDTFKIVIPLGLMGIKVENLLMPLHLPIGSLITASIFTLFFKDHKKLVLSLLVLGVITHYALDLLLINLNGGMVMLFPFSWNSWTLDVVPNDDWHITILAMGLAVVVYFVSSWFKNRGNNLDKNIQ
ncbi:metal-dependent hydrolase [Methanobacterium sp.]|uniref:metal-dependent hydrolase n=1 Tax=Methanobacterium sp. TaxID=2164 RepID=UPI003C765122